jgi:hypothetical protein
MSIVPSAPSATAAGNAARCPVCKTRMVVHGPDEVVVKNAILRVETRSGRVTAKCGRCKTWVEVPLRYVG